MLGEHLRFWRPLQFESGQHFQGVKTGACLITGTLPFIPSKPQRQLRELTRYRSTLVQDRARTLNRLQAVLEDANLKLASVVTDIYGVSARAMLEAILAGERDVEALADLARGRLRAKRDQLKEALEGRVTAHQSFLLTEHLSTLEYLDEAIARVSGEIRVVP